MKHCIAILNSFLIFDIAWLCSEKSVESPFSSVCVVYYSFGFTSSFSSFLVILFLRLLMVWIDVHYRLIRDVTVSSILE